MRFLPRRNQKHEQAEPTWTGVRIGHPFSMPFACTSARAEGEDAFVGSSAGRLTHANKSAAIWTYYLYPLVSKQVRSRIL